MDRSLEIFIGLILIVYGVVGIYVSLQKQAQKKNEYKHIKAKRYIGLGAAIILGVIFIFRL